VACGIHKPQGIGVAVEVAVQRRRLIDLAEEAVLAQESPELRVEVPRLGVEETCLGVPQVTGEGEAVLGRGQLRGEAEVAPGVLGDYRRSLSAFIPSCCRRRRRRLQGRRPLGFEGAPALSGFAAERVYRGWRQREDLISKRSPLGLHMKDGIGREGIVLLRQPFEVFDDLAVGHSIVDPLTPRNDARKGASFAVPPCRDFFLIFVVGDEDTAQGHSVFKVREVGSPLGEGLDSSQDVPAGISQGLDERAMDISVRVQREAPGHLLVSAPGESLSLTAFVSLVPSLLGLERLLDLIGMVVVVGERRVDLRQAEVGIRLEDLLGGLPLLVQIDDVRDADPGVVNCSLAAAVTRLLHDVRVRDLRRRGHDRAYFSALSCGWHAGACRPGPACPPSYKRGRGQVLVSEELLDLPHACPSL